MYNERKNIDIDDLKNGIIFKIELYNLNFFRMLKRLIY